MPELKIICRPQEPTQEDWDSDALDVEELARDHKIPLRQLMKKLLNFEQPFSELYCTHIHFEPDNIEQVASFRVIERASQKQLGVIFIPKPLES